MPGFADVFANPLWLHNILIKLDFPTFDRPINAYSAFVSSGHFVTFGDEIVNSDFFIIIKADKLSPAKAKSNALLWMKKLEDRWENLPPYFITSAEQKMGKDEVLDYIEQINETLV